MTILTAVIDGNPLPAQRTRSSNGRHYNTDTYDTELNRLAAEFRMAWGVIEPLQGDVMMRVVWYRQTNHPVDIDNLGKALQDAAVRAGVMGDDRQIKAAPPLLEVDRNNPRLVVGFYTADTAEYKEYRRRQLLWAMTIRNAVIQEP